MESDWEKILTDYLDTLESDDAAHDIGHFRRVAQTAKQISLLEAEPTDPLILMAAAYFHDLVNLPKNHPENMFSSRYSAQKAREILFEIRFPSEKIPAICHAIEAHSFTACIKPKTLEAKIIQDADRMEALGALGIMRTFYVAGRIGSTTHHPEDPFATRRPLDDKTFALDHFYCKLLKLPELLQTKGGQEIARKRTLFLHFFIDELKHDLQKKEGGSLFVVDTTHNAGKRNHKLFHLTDAFAEKRLLSPDCFALDKLIASRESYPDFISAFINQVREELAI